MQIAVSHWLAGMPNIQAAALVAAQFLGHKITPGTRYICGHGYAPLIIMQEGRRRGAMDSSNTSTFSTNGSRDTFDLIRDLVDVRATG